MNLGVLTSFDESVGKVIAALDEKNMLKNSIILLIADNGGATEDSNAKSRFKNSASNWPLRGVSCMTLLCLYLFSNENLKLVFFF